MQDQSFRPIRLAAAGGVAGLVIFLIFNPSQVRHESLGFDPVSSLGTIILQTMLLASAFAVMTAGMLVISEEFGSPAKRIAVRLASAAAIAAIAGVAAGAAAQILYMIGRIAAVPFALIPGPFAFIVQSLARAAGWAVMGGGGGVGIGYALGSWKRARMSSLGGLAGGFAGGLVFDGISQVTGGGSVSRFVGFVVMGTAIGAAVSVVEDLVKKNWVAVLSGPKEGKSYILTKPTTTIGRDELADIPLFTDPSVAKQHAVLRLSGTTVALESVAGARVSVNGSPTNQAVLKDSDTFKIGAFSLRFHQKESRQTAADGGQKRWFEPKPAAPQPSAQDTAAHTVRVPPQQTVLAPQPSAQTSGTMLLKVTTGPHAGQSFGLQPGRTVVGRIAGCAVLLDRDTMVSRNHAEITSDGITWNVQDLGSTNGLWVNGVRTSSAALTPGDEIRVGESTLRIEPG